MPVRASTPRRPRPRGLALLLLHAAVAALAVTLLSPAGAAVPRAPRVRRKVVFPKGGLFFVRLNAKDNFIPNSTIFAFAYGFRINYPLPSTIKESPYHRRDLHSDVAELLFRHGLDGGACVQRAVCEASQLQKPRGLFQRALKLIFTTPEQPTALRADPRGRRPRAAAGAGAEAEAEAPTAYHEAAAQQCAAAHERCPFSLLFAAPPP